MAAMLMGVLHTAVFANRQTLARGLQFFHAHVFLFARFQTFGGAFVRGGNCTVALDILLGFLVAVFLLCY